MSSTATRRRKGKGRSERVECPVSGVVLSAAPATDHVGEAVERTLRRRCELMRWEPTEAHMKQARDQRLATLYGRLHVAGRICEDAYLGVSEWAALDICFRREVMGTETATHDHPTAGAETRDERIVALRTHWEAARVLLAAQPVAQGYWLELSMRDDEETRPDQVPQFGSEAVRLIGRELARHFGLRC